MTPRREFAGEVWDTAKVAEVLGITPRKVQILIGREELTPLWLGFPGPRFDRVEVEALKFRGVR